MDQQVKPNIRDLSFDKLDKLLSDRGEKPFRVKQISEWLWKKHARSFDEMTNLSKSTRAWLGSEYDIKRVEVAEEQKSEDGTIKSAFQLPDGHIVEGVLIPAEGRMTACISSQVGCSLSCAFCATGTMKRMKNLSGYEIYDQVVNIARQAEKYYDHPLTNIVFMGMGEPLMNFKGMMESIDYLTSEKGLGMSAKRITVSTAGIARMIKRMADECPKVNLALSLHAASEEKRDKIMPINQSNSLDSLAEALSYYRSKTRANLTYEYIAFKDFNDSIEDAKNLVSFCKKVPAKVNIIEYNPVDHADFEKPSIQKVDAFAAFLEANDVRVTIRRSRGKDIDAACGQLANKNDAVKKA